MQLNKEEMLTLLHREIIPVLGCIGPACVVLCAADACHATGGQMVSIKTEVNPGIYENGMSIDIPGFQRVGLEYATALGVCLSNPERGLRLLEEINSTVNKKAVHLAKDKRVSMTIAEGGSRLYAHVEIIITRGIGISTTRSAHSDIIYTSTNNEVLLEKEHTAGGEDAFHAKSKSMIVAQLRKLTDSAGEEELAFMLEGAEVSETLSDYGLKHRLGIGIANTLKTHLSVDITGSSLMARTMVQVASSTEGCTSGCPYAVMSGAGSGSHGIITIAPMVEMARHLGSNWEATVEALALSHLLNVYVKLFTGKLSTTYDCGVPAATTAPTAMVWLLGGDDKQIGVAIINMSANLTGMIYDGGKIGCTLKLVTTISAAVMNAYLTVGGVVVNPSDGICVATPEQVIRDMGHISTSGTAGTGHTILSIMVERGRG